MTQRRVLHSADLHLELLRYGATHATQEAMLDRLVETAREHSVDVVVIAGDAFHSRRPGSAALHAFARFVDQITSFTHLLLTPGNHDGPGEVDDTYLKPAGWMAELNLPRVHAVPDLAAVVVADLEFNVLPYIHRRGMMADHAEEVVRSLVDRPASKGLARILVAHQTIAGSKLSADNFMQIGWDLTLEQSWIRPFDVAMLGHIHHQQVLAPFMAYSGAPERFDFGDEFQDKGFLLWEFEGDAPLTITPLPSGARRMVTLTTSPTPDAGWLNEVMPGDVVRVQVDVGHGISAGGRASIDRDIRAAVLATDASWARIEYRVSQSTVRRSRAQLDPNAEVMDALRQWCELNEVDYEKLEPVARRIVHG